MQPRRAACIFALALLAAGSASDCGGGDLTLPGDYPTPTAAPTTTCGAAGSVCDVDSDCCSGVCTTTDNVNFSCQ